MPRHTTKRNNKILILQNQIPNGFHKGFPVLPITCWLKQKILFLRHMWLNRNPHTGWEQENK